MTSADYAAVFVLVCLGIVVVILIGLILFNIARYKSAHATQNDNMQRGENDEIMPENTESITLKKEFPAPWRAKVWTDAVPPVKEMEAEKFTTKSKRRQAPVIIRASGATERPGLKQSPVTMKKY